MVIVHAASDGQRHSHDEAGEEDDQQSQEGVATGFWVPEEVDVVYAITQQRPFAERAARPANPNDILLSYLQVSAGAST